MNKPVEMTMEDIPEDAIITKMTPHKNLSVSQKSQKVNVSVNSTVSNTNQIKQDEVSKEKVQHQYHLAKKIVDEINKTNKEFLSCFPKGSLMKSGFLACFEDENGITKRTI